MLRPLFALALALLVATPASAQRCDGALEHADAEYLAGDFDDAIDRLTACLDAGSFSDSERRRAYRLVGLSYIGKDREAEARAAVASLLEVAPNYQPDPALDPPPFVRMVADARRRRPRSAGANAAAGPGVGVALRGHGLFYTDSDDDTLAGGGLDLGLGYRVTPMLSARARAAVSLASGDAFDGRLLEVGGGVRAQLGSGQASPYLGAGATFQSARYQADGASATYSGPGGTLEAGVLFALTPSLSVDGGLTATVASLSTSGRSDAIAATTVRLGVGLAWRP